MDRRVKAAPLGLGLRNPGRRRGRVWAVNIIRVKWSVAPLFGKKNKGKPELLPRRLKEGKVITDARGYDYRVARGGNPEKV